MANVELSNEEWNVLSNADFLLTKNAVIQKMLQAFSDLSKQYKQIIGTNKSSWEKYVTITPKISKGEQYKGLPYLMLDYPRQFERTGIFAIRSFFWWGQYFSISLLATGIYKEILQAKIPDIRLDNWYLDMSDSPWNHDLDKNQYSLLNSLDAIPENPAFLKLFKQLPVNQWQNMEEFFLSSFLEIWRAISYLDDGTDLLPDDPTSKNRL